MWAQDGVRYIYVTGGLQRSCIETAYARVFGLHWMQFALREDWVSKLGHFFNVLAREWGFHRLLNGLQQNEMTEHSSFRKRPGVTQQSFTCDVLKCVQGDPFRCVIFGDSLVAVNWLNAEWAARKHVFKRTLSEMWALLCVPEICPLAPWGNLFEHIFWEQNTAADGSAGHA